MNAIHRLANLARYCRYSRLIGEDERGTLARLKTIRAELVDQTITRAKRPRLVKTTGDGLLIEIVSMVNALRSATELQAMGHHVSSRGSGRRLLAMMAASLRQCFQPPPAPSA